MMLRDTKPQNITVMDRQHCQDPIKLQFGINFSKETDQKKMVTKRKDELYFVIHLELHYHDIMQAA